MDAYEAPVMTELAALPVEDHTKRVRALRQDLPPSPMRTWLAVALAKRLFDEQQHDFARSWAMRALQDGPRVDVFCLLGEIAIARDEREEAVRWYEQACADAWLPKPCLSLVQGKTKRLIELRQGHPVRSVRWRHRDDPHHVLAVMSIPTRWPSAILGKHGTMKEQSWPSVEIYYTDDVGVGQAQAFFRVLREALRLHPRLTALTLFEDDVVLARNALDYIASVEIDPDLVLVSWFTTDQNLLTTPSPVLSTVPATDYMFNQAVTLPARTVHALLASEALRTWPEKHGADRIYGRVFGSAPCAVHFPNLVQHVGGTASATGNNDHGPRLSSTFIGEDADALDLIGG